MSTWDTIKVPGIASAAEAAQAVERARQRDAEVLLQSVQSGVGEIPTGTGVVAVEVDTVAPTRVMEFVGVDVGVLAAGMFNTMRVGRRWADLRVGETVRLTCTEEAGGPEVGDLEATVVHVATGVVHELVRGHSATNFSVRDEPNPPTRDAALNMELIGIYNDPDATIKGGTVVYLMPSSPVEWDTDVEDVEDVEETLRL